MKSIEEYQKMNDVLAKVAQEQGAVSSTERAVKLPPPTWGEKLIERLEVVQCIVSVPECTDEELQCAYDELDDIIKMVRDGLEAT